MNWNASWIWLEQAMNNPTTSLLVRKEFSLENLPSVAQLAISANHIYRVYINGKCVGRGPDRADPRPRAKRDHSRLLRCNHALFRRRS